MSSSERIERERLAKRNKILDAARELFVERGVEAVTLREIAQRIEYSTTAIYVQFKDKQELVEHMVREDFAKFASALLRAANVVDPVERLQRIGDEYMTFALSMPRHYQLLFMTPMKKKPSHGAPALEPNQLNGIQGYRLLHRTVQEIMDAKRFFPEHTDSAALAQIIWAGIHGLVSLHIVAGAQQDLVRRHDARHVAASHQH
jgi:AcrR family transcriptional regulator